MFRLEVHIHCYFDPYQENRWREIGRRLHRLDRCQIHVSRFSGCKNVPLQEAHLDLGTWFSSQSNHAHIQPPRESYLSESFALPVTVFFLFGVGILHSIENATQLVHGTPKLAASHRTYLHKSINITASSHRAMTESCNPDSRTNAVDDQTSRYLGKRSNSYLSGVACLYRRFQLAFEPICDSHNCDPRCLGLRAAPKSPSTQKVKLGGNNQTQCNLHYKPCSHVVYI